MTTVAQAIHDSLPTQDFYAREYEENCLSGGLDPIGSGSSYRAALHRCCAEFDALFAGLPVDPEWEATKERARVEQNARWAEALRIVAQTEITRRAVIAANREREAA